MIVRDCTTQYHFIMITHRALPTENEIVNEVLYDSKNKYLYRVFVNICKKSALIITVYKTSKIEKYENKI